MPETWSTCVIWASSHADRSVPDIPRQLTANFEQVTNPAPPIV